MEVGGRLTNPYEMISNTLDLPGSSEYSIDVRVLRKSLRFTNSVTASYLR